MVHQTITVCFTSLLEKIVEAIGLGTPIYSRGHPTKEIAYVVVPFKTKLDAYVFSGSEASTIAESCEQAARKASVFLVRNNNICVHDVNIEKKRRLRRCRELYMYKRHELECIEKGIESQKVEMLVGEQEIRPMDSEVWVDFVAILREVVTKVNIHVAPIECVQYGPTEYVAWLAFAEPDSDQLVDCIIGDRAMSINQAKQNLAQKAIRFFVPLYGFIIEDVSYHLLDVEELGVNIARQNYLKTKERVHGLKEEVALIPTVVEQDQLTPRGPKFTIFTPENPPLPPKKRRIEEASTSYRTATPTVPYSVVIKELGLFSTPKRNN